MHLDGKVLSYKRLLDVDNRLFLPLNVIIFFMVTSSDVLHSFSITEAGLKVDSVPGRINTISTFFEKEGVFYGQCSELCGVGHAFMPIVVNIINYKN